MGQRNKIPYALTNFESIRTENYLYVDKTRFIEKLENSEGYTDIYLRQKDYSIEEIQ